MAAIGSIRKHSTILLVFVGVALLAFLLGDLANNRGNNKLSEQFIRVGNDYISHYNYMDKYDVYRDIQKKNKEDGNLTPEEDFRLGTQVYDELVDSLIFSNQTNYLGITVTDEELVDLVSGPQPHELIQQTGIFRTDSIGYSMQLAQQFLLALQQNTLSPADSLFIEYYMQIESYIIKETFNKKYLNLLSGAYYLPKSFAQKISDEASLKADLEVVQLPYTSEIVSDDKISVTEKELEKCYQENKYRFKQEEEHRDVEYVIFNIEPTETDLQDIENEVRQSFEEFKQTDRPDLFVNRFSSDSRYDSTYMKRGVLDPGIDTALFDAPTGTLVEPYIDGDYWKFAKLLSTQVRPDSINVSYFMIYHNGTQNNPRKKAEADKIADTAYMMGMIGYDFHSLAKQYSDDEVPENVEQFSQWFIDGSGGRIQMFFDTLYKLMPGAVMKYEERGLTWIFKVNQQTSLSKKVRVAVARKQITASSETINKVENAANNFANGTDTYQKFADAVVAKNLDKRTNDRVMKMTYTLPGIPEGGREIIRWIFDENTEKGTVSQVFSLENMYVVVALKDIYPEGYRTLSQEQVRTQIEAIVKRDKKAEKLKEILKEALAKNESLSTIATNNNTTTNTLSINFSDRNFGYYGPELKVIGEILAQSSTGKTEILQGEMGVYAVKINKIETPTLDATLTNEKVDMIAQQNKNMYQNSVTNNGTRALRKMYKIEDNRYKVM
ncbi:MAG: SurA N-terminal domain-containing protein [Bacteroidales bacterium]|jgi:peptidyl-prolyl cis-trans isomerase D|nr:SurA N-terminal domain-containing protein [Bacteroidales bacterium]